MRRTCGWGLVAMLLAVTGVQAGLLEDMGIDSEASKLVKEQNYAPAAKQAPPAQHASAEGLPPLPLPAVPLRRTEKKNPPRPPVLIAKLANKEQVDWATSPEDADNLLRFMAGQLKVSFSSMNLPEENIPEDASQIPVLYKSGIRAFSFAPETQQRLRKYLLSGGTLVLNAYCGHPDFARSAMTEMQKILPERSPYRLALDHPLYHSYFDIKDIRYRPLALKANAQNGVPSVIGIDINTRTAIFFFRYDVSTAWDGMKGDQRHIVGYEVDTARQLGANLMAYLTAERNTAVSLAQGLEFVDADQQKAGKFMIAQARYNGLWKPRDAALSMLLKVFNDKTSTPVRFQEADIDLDSPKLFDVPFVYLTGQMDFAFTERERENLRNYLARGGVLFAEAACGRPSFDLSFRREMARILPESKLEKLPPDHLLFRFPNTIVQLTPRPALAAQLQNSGRVPPLLLGAEVNGHLAVIYSPWDLAGGWSLAQGPYNVGVEGSDALALGVNVLSFVLTQ